MSTTLTSVSAQLAQLLSAVPGDLSGLQSSLSTALSDLNQTNANIASLQTAIQTMVSNLQVAATREAPASRKAWVLQTTYQGQLVNATVTSVYVVLTSSNGPTVVQPATVASVVPLSPGIVEVTLSAVPNNAQLVQFNTQYAVSSSILAAGSAISQ